MTDAAPRPVTTKIVAPIRGRDKAPRTSSGSRKKNLTKPLTDFFTSIGGMVAVVNKADGIAIITGAEDLAKALNNVAKDNAVVYRNLERMLTGSAWGSVFVAAGAIALPIAANHNLLPFQIPGLTPEPTPANVESMPPAPTPDIEPERATG